MKEKEKQVYQILKQYGYNDKQISGIMANILVQTGGTFDYTTKQKGGKGHGLFQFDFHQKFYDDYTKKHDLKDSARSQIQYMHSTIKGQNKLIIGQGNAQKINRAFKNGTTTQIAQSFCDFFEKPRIPHLQRRLEAAKNYENIFSMRPQEQYKKIQVIKPAQTSLTSTSSVFSLPTYQNDSMISSVPSFNFGYSSSSSSGFGLSEDRSNYGYTFDNGSRLSSGFSTSGPSISISIPCQIM